MNWVYDSGWAGLCRVLPQPVANCENYFHSFDMSWTAYWGIQFLNALPENKKEVIAFSSALANFFVEQQQESGVFPSWYQVDTLEVYPSMWVMVTFAR